MASTSNSSPSGESSSDNPSRLFQSMDAYLLSIDADLQAYQKLAERTPDSLRAPPLDAEMEMLPPLSSTCSYCAVLSHVNALSFSRFWKNHLDFLDSEAQSDTKSSNENNVQDARLFRCRYFGCFKTFARAENRLRHEKLAHRKKHLTTRQKKLLQVTPVVQNEPSSFEDMITLLKSEYQLLVDQFSEGIIPKSYTMESYPCRELFSIISDLSQVSNKQVKEETYRSVYRKLCRWVAEVLPVVAEFLESVVQKSLENQSISGTTLHAYFAVSPIFSRCLPFLFNFIEHRPIFFESKSISSNEQQLFTRQTSTNLIQGLLRFVRALRTVHINMLSYGMGIGSHDHTEIQRIIVETPHPYPLTFTRNYDVKIPGATFLVLDFDENCATPGISDLVTMWTYVGDEKRRVDLFRPLWGCEAIGVTTFPLNQRFVVSGDNISFGIAASYDSDASQRWGFRCTVTGYLPSSDSAASHSDSPAWMIWKSAVTALTSVAQRLATRCAPLSEEETLFETALDCDLLQGGLDFCAVLGGDFRKGEVVDQTCFDFLSDSNIATVLHDDDDPFSTEASDLLLELCSSKSHPGSIASTLLHLLESISENTLSHSGVPFTPAFLSPNPVVFPESVFSVETKMTSRLQGPEQVEPEFELDRSSSLLIQECSRRLFALILKMAPGGVGVEDAVRVIAEDELITSPQSYSSVALSLSWRCARRVRDWILSRANSTLSKERTCENFNHRVKELCVVALLKITVALGFRSWISKGCDGSSEYVSDKNAERIGYFAREDRGMAEYHAQTPSHLGASVDNFLRNTESWEPLTPMIDTPSLNRDPFSRSGGEDEIFVARTPSASSGSAFLGRAHSFPMSADEDITQNPRALAYVANALQRFMSSVIRFLMVPVPGIDDGSVDLVDRTSLEEPSHVSNDPGEGTSGSHTELTVSSSEDDSSYEYRKTIHEALVVELGVHLNRSLKLSNESTSNPEPVPFSIETARECIDQCSRTVLYHLADILAQRRNRALARLEALSSLSALLVPISSPIVQRGSSSEPENDPVIREKISIPDDVTHLVFDVLSSILRFNDESLRKGLSTLHYEHHISATSHDIRSRIQRVYRSFLSIVSSILQRLSLTESFSMPPSENTSGIDSVTMQPLPSHLLCDLCLRFLNMPYGEGDFDILDSEGIFPALHAFMASTADVSSYRRPHRFTWCEGGSDVAIIGSFTGWKRFVPMQQVSGGEFVVEIPLPCGTHQYRFLVDGVLRLSDTIPSVRDNRRRYVHSLTIDPDAQTAIASVGVTEELVIDEDFTLQNCEGCVERLLDNNPNTFGVINNNLTVKIPVSENFPTEMGFLLLRQRDDDKCPSSIVITRTCAGSEPLAKNFDGKWDGWFFYPFPEASRQVGSSESYNVQFSHSWCSNCAIRGVRLLRKIAIPVPILSERSRLQSVAFDLFSTIADRLLATKVNTSIGSGLQVMLSGVRSGPQGLSESARRARRRMELSQRRIFEISLHILRRKLVESTGEELPDFETSSFAFSDEASCVIPEGTSFAESSSWLIQGSNVSLESDVDHVSVEFLPVESESRLRKATELASIFDADEEIEEIIELLRRYGDDVEKTRRRLSLAQNIHASYKLSIVSCVFLLELLFFNVKQAMAFLDACDSKFCYLDEFGNLSEFVSDDRRSSAAVVYAPELNALEMSELPFGDYDEVSESIIHRVRPVAQEEIEMEPEVEPVVLESSLSVEDAPKTERPSFDSFVRAAMMATSGSSDAVLSCDVNGIVNFSRGPQLKEWSEFLSHEELPLYLEVGDRLSEILELGYDLFLLQLLFVNDGLLPDASTALSFAEFIPRVEQHLESQGRLLDSASFVSLVCESLENARSFLLREGIMDPKFNVERARKAMQMVKQGGFPFHASYIAIRENYESIDSASYSIIDSRVHYEDVAMALTAKFRSELGKVGPLEMSLIRSQIEDLKRLNLDPMMSGDDSPIFNLLSVIQILSNTPVGESALIRRPRPLQVIVACIRGAQTARVIRSAVSLYVKALSLLTPRLTSSSSNMEWRVLFDAFSSLVYPHELPGATPEICMSLAMDVLLFSISRGLSVEIRDFRSNPVIPSTALGDGRRRNALYSGSWIPSVSSDIPKPLFRELSGAIASLVKSSDVWKRPLHDILVKSILELVREQESTNLIIEQLFSFWRVISLFSVDHFSALFLTRLFSDVSKSSGVDLIVEERATGGYRIKFPSTPATQLLFIVDPDTRKVVVELKHPSDTQAEYCRFCDSEVSDTNRWKGAAISGPGLKNVCENDFCIDRARISSDKILSCGHICFGLRSDVTLFPCLNGCEVDRCLGMDAEDYCSVCFTEPLRSAPCAQLKCGHIFHFECIKAQIQSGWNGAAISFSFTQCPACRADIDHPAYADLTGPIFALRERMHSLALAQAEVDGLANEEEVVSPEGSFHNDVLGAALHRYNFYQCFQCKKPYYGGERVCGAGGAQQYDSSELVCPECVAGARQVCKVHGSSNILFRCRYCCSPAVWFCFGTTHFCERCHNILDYKVHPCPGPETCPIGGNHPPNGEEYCIGCGLCLATARKS